MRHKRDPKKEKEKQERRERLSTQAAANPTWFFTFEEVGLILGFGGNAMTALSSAGAPQAFRKMNPKMVCDWISQNQDLIGKIQGPSE